MQKTRVALFFLALYGVVAAAACGSGAAQPPPFKPVADTKLLMQAMIDPTADEIWDAVKTIITKDGTQEIRPHTNAEWEAVRHHAVVLAESGNLLMMVPRAKDGGEWMKRAQDLVETSERAIHAAEAKNADQLFTVGGDIYESCSGCHQKYMEAIVNATK